MNPSVPKEHAADGRGSDTETVLTPEPADRQDAGPAQNRKLEDAAATPRENEKSRELRRPETRRTDEDAQPRHRLSRAQRLAARARRSNNEAEVELQQQRPRTRPRDGDDG